MNLNTRYFLSLLDFSKHESNYLQRFNKVDIVRIEKALKNEDEEIWWEIGEKKTLRLFQEGAKRIPAYKDFLRKHKIDPLKIKTIKDFGTHVPVQTKDNYNNYYPLRDRMWDGKLFHAQLIALSSGTTGAPKFWPRSREQEFEAAIIHELLYHNFFDIDKKKTLVVIAFPLGVYVSGIATTLPTFLLSQKGYEFTSLTAGLNKDSILDAIKNTASDFAHLVFFGHPFFIKDIIETGADRGISWASYDVNIMTCSEGFSEEWREYLLSYFKKSTPVTSVINTYGASEMLLIGHETPLSISLRKKIGLSPVFKKSIFGEEAIVPNIFQYNPILRYIEEDTQSNLLFTSWSGIPLIRYAIGDRGKIIRYSKMIEKLKIHGNKTQHTVNTPPDNTHWKLPFVSLSGRIDHAILFHGINIYPEFIHLGLNNKKLLPFITGKFVFEKMETKTHDPFMQVHVELKNKITPTKQLAKNIAVQLTNTLQKVCIEFRFLSQNLKKDFSPKIVLWSYQSEKYFTPGVKPKYIIR